MMSPKNAFNSLLNRSWQKWADEPADMLLVTGALGWILSSFAQVAGIVLNKDIDKEKKLFLIPQEILDGVVNVLLFWSITRYTGDFGKKLIDHGKVVFNTGKKFLEKHKIDVKSLTAENNLFKLIKEKGSADEIASFTKGRKGFGLATNILGSIVACNIVTPIVRNYLGGIYQKHSIDHQKQDSQIFALPILPNETIQRSVDSKLFSPFSTSAAGSLKI